MRRLLCSSWLLLLFACGARTPLDEYLPSDAASASDSKIEASPDSNKSDCIDSSVTHVYVVTDLERIYAFRPATGSFSLKGTLDCPALTGSPFSMGVDRKGAAYVVYSDGNLYKVSTATGHCTATNYEPGTSGFDLFGMGYSTDQGGPTEKLYLALSGLNSALTPRLGWLDTTTWKIQLISTLSDNGMELTGTGDGRLYGFFDNDIAAHLVQLDKKTGKYLSDEELPGVSKGNAWAFAFWGGDFWFFTSPSGYSTVTRYQPSSKSIQVVAQLTGERIVGAGVSTCAPEQ